MVNLVKLKRELHRLIDSTNDAELLAQIYATLSAADALRAILMDGLHDSSHKIS